MLSLDPSSVVPRSALGGDQSGAVEDLSDELDQRLCRERFCQEALYAGFDIGVNLKTADDDDFDGGIDSP